LPERYPPATGQARSRGVCRSFLLRNRAAPAANCHYFTKVTGMSARLTTCRAIEPNV
jgi:hypothetical protein